MKNQFLKYLLFINLKSLPSIVLLFLVSTLFFSACNVEERYSNTGEFSFSLKAENDLTQVTRSDELPDIALPDVNDFLIIIEKKDGSVHNVYESLTEITGPLTLPVGDYEITASYGLDSKEGFGLNGVYYEGKAEFSILENQSTAVEVTCSLANVVVSVDLSDVFVKYFANYTVMARSLTTNQVFMFTEENDILYLKPGGFSLILDVTKQNGVSSTYEPITVTDSKAQQYYILNVDVNEGNVGGERLVITFSDETDSEAIEIDLSDEAMSAKEPFFTLTGFESGVPIEIAEGTHLGDLSVLITARGSFKSCVITTQSPFLTTDIWPSPVDLINIPGAQEVVLKRYGLNWTSTLPQAAQNPDLKMAVLEFSDLLPHLKTVNGEGEHEFTLVVVDQNNKKSEELKLIVQTRQNSLTLKTPEPVLIGSPSALFTVETEGDIKQLEIQYLDDYGVWHSESFEVISSEDKEYVVRATLPIQNKPLQVRAKYNSVTSPIEYLDVIVPKFSLELESEGDVWATKAYLKLIPENLDELEVIKKYLTVYANENAVTVSYENEDRLILSGLLDNTQMTIKATCGKNEYPHELIIHTEPVIDLPNGNFENGWSVFYDKTIDQSGKFGRWGIFGTTWGNGGKPLTQNLLVHSLSGWKSVNEKTMPDSPTVENTWYIVPSTERTEDTYDGQYAMKLRNVAWDNNGASISDYTPVTLTTPSYSQSQPSISNRSVGKLFLGEYSYNHETREEIYDEGIEFTSRPLSLSGYYMFKDLGNDEGGTVTIIVENNEDETIVLTESSAVLTAVDGYTYFNVPLVYEVNDKKATHLKVMFTSSTKSSYNQQEETASITTVNRMSVTEAVSTGSELYLDNIQLNYE